MPLGRPNRARRQLAVLNHACGHPLADKLQDPLVRDGGTTDQGGAAHAGIRPGSTRKGGPTTVDRLAPTSLVLGCTPD